MELTPTNNINVHKFKSDNNFLFFHAKVIRKKVFVVEQKVRPEEELDEFEKQSTHYLAYYGARQVGTARWRFTEEGIKLERFAVIEKYRNLAIGSAILNKVLEDVKNEGKKIYLHAQVSAVKFYERAGFVKEGGLFSECNIDHYKMVYKAPSKGLKFDF